MFKKHLATLAALLLLVGAGCGASVTSNTSSGVPADQPGETRQPAPTPAPNPAPVPPPTSGQTSGTEKSYTVTEVAAHKDATSCWSLINGNVYDLTTWVGKHPGGEEAILSICGKDGSAAFNGQHGGQQLQANVLAGFKIGTLKK